MLQCLSSLAYLLLSWSSICSKKDMVSSFMPIDWSEETRVGGYSSPPLSRAISPGAASTSEFKFRCRALHKSSIRQTWSHALCSSSLFLSTWTPSMSLYMEFAIEITRRYFWCPASTICTALFCSQHLWLFAQFSALSFNRIFCATIQPKC